MENRFLILQETQRPPSGEKTTPFREWLEHLLVTPVLHHAVQKANEFIGIWKWGKFN